MASARKPAGGKAAAKTAAPKTPRGRKPAAKAPAKKASRKPASKPAKAAAPKAGTRQKPGPAPKHPVEQTADDIKVMVACGFEHARIARILKISTATMQKHYKDQLELGSDMANFEVGRTIFRAAVAGDKGAMSLWAARRMNWKETVDVSGTLNVNQVRLVAPDLPMPEEDPDEDYGFEDFEDEDFGDGEA